MLPPILLTFSTATSFPRKWSPAAGQLIIGSDELQGYPSHGVIAAWRSVSAGRKVSHFAGEKWATATLACLSRYLEPLNDMTSAR